MDKIEDTKRRNHTFRTSKPEELLYLYIKEKFPDVIREYKEKRYPFKCDFYIPKLDYFIELNGHYTHGYHPFDENNKEDIDRLNTLKEKYKDFYIAHHRWPSIISTWSIRDIIKRNTANKNNLSYKEVWSLEEGKKFIDELYESIQ